MGRLPFDAGLAILVASIVNLHHFVLDGAIWKLRDGRVARILLRARHTATESTLDAGGRPTALASGAMWLAGGACVLILFGARIDTDVLLRRAASARDVSAVADSLDRLARVGRDSARRRLTLGRALEQQGDSRGAMAAYRRSLELQPRGETWFLVASIQARGGLWEPALASLDAALRLAPDLELVHYERGAVLLELDRPAEARDAFARAAELNPERGINRTLEARAAALATEKTR